MGWDLRHFQMNEGRKAAGRWFVGGCVGMGVCVETSGGWRRRKEQREPRQVGRAEYITSGRFILGLFNV